MPGPKISTLVDDFSSPPSPGVWALRSATTAYDAANKRIALTLNTTDYAEIASVRKDYDLIESAVAIQVTLPSLTTGYFDLYMEAAVGSSNFILWDVSGTTLTLAYNTSPPYRSYTVAQVPYNATQHAWWRTRETGGNVYFEVSPDGMQWTIIGSFPTPGFVKSSGIGVRPSGSLNTGTTRTAYIDSVNVYPAAWARLTGPKGYRPLPVMTHHPPARHILSLQNSFVVYDGSWTTPQLYRTWDGLCFMEGLIRKNDSSSFGAQLICNIPPGFRPSDRTLINSVGSGDGTQLFQRIDVDPNGDVTFSAGSASVWLSMTGRWYAVM